MSTKSNGFEGTPIYVGVDVHLKSWRIAPFTDQTALKKFTISPPSVDQLASILEVRYPGASFMCCYEAGFSGFWLQRELRRRGFDTMVVNPADIPITNKDQRRKTDSRDAAKIGRELRAGNLEAVYVPSQEAEAARALVRYRGQVVKDERRVKQRIKMHLHFKGVQLSGQPINWSKRKIEYLKGLAGELGDEYLVLSLKQLEDLRASKQEISEKIKQMSRSKPYRVLSYLLQSIPGISYLGSMILITEIIDMQRFSSLDQLCSYIGLVPDTGSSGETERVRGITKRSNRRLRTFLIECAWIAVRQDPALSKAYSSYTHRMKGQKAIIKIARKLLSRIRYVWLKKEPYQLGIC